MRLSSYFKQLIRETLIELLGEERRYIVQEMREQREQLQLFARDIHNLHNSLQAISNKTEQDRNSLFIEIDKRITGANDRFESIESLSNEIYNNVCEGVRNQHRYLPSLIALCDETNTNTKTTVSYCLNSLNTRRNITSSPEGQYYSHLCEQLTIYAADDTISLKRFGRDNDGGYIMATPPSSTKIAYSFGISDDVSWDLDMAKNGYAVFQYDHTINKLPVDNTAFNWKKVGLTGDKETDTLKQLETLMVQNGHDGLSGMVLKIDIEGDEWAVLTNLKKEFLEKFDQIVVELHGLNDLKNAERTIAAIKRINSTHIPLRIHGNNYKHAVFYGDSLIPDVMEVTWIKRDYIGSIRGTSPSAPVIDQPNRDSGIDYPMGAYRDPRGDIR